MAYIIMDYSVAEDELRSIFGIDEDVLTNEQIHLLPNLPAAEIEGAARIADLAILSGRELDLAKLAILYLTAANCLDIVKLNILKSETDNKTTGIRFTDAFSLTKDELRGKADKFISEVNALVDSAIVASTDILSVFSPLQDEVTGA